MPSEDSDEEIVTEYDSNGNPIKKTSALRLVLEAAWRKFQEKNPGVAQVASEKVSGRKKKLDEVIDEQSQ